MQRIGAGPRVGSLEILIQDNLVALEKFVVLAQGHFESEA